MNKRIRELAEQATDKWVGGQFFDREKFAELIVKECAEFARQHNLAKADRSYLIHQAIQEYFGVKE